MQATLPTIPEMLAAAKGRPLLSFEFSPPKDDAGQDLLHATILELDQLNPDFVSVTYGASGSTRDRTLGATQFIKKRVGPQTIGHLTCASQSSDDLRDVVRGYAEVGVNHVLAIRGDMPGGPKAPWVRHPEGLDNATELVRLVKEVDPAFVVGVAAFPDGHPDKHDLALDARLMLAKQEAGAEFAITQLFFDPAAYVRLRSTLDAIGCTLPVIAGVMPVTSLGQIERLAEMSGAPLPEAMVARLQAVGDDPQAVRRVGVDLAVEFCQALLDEGVPGLHYFTFNRARATREIVARLADS
ncbi:MAG: methylenetetrahydrofolate reductase [Propionibacteriaceae bacterium]